LSEETEEAVQVVEVLEERAAEGEPVAQVVERAALREVRRVPPEVLREPQPEPPGARPVLPQEQQQRPPERRQEP
jgi:hypothetical protein